jgi:hypothetical protein
MPKCNREEVPAVARWRSRVLLEGPLVVAGEVSGAGDGPIPPPVGFWASTNSVAVSVSDGRFSRPLTLAAKLRESRA